MSLSSRAFNDARVTLFYPFTTFVGRGLVVGGGSDSPITELDPMFGVWALENHHDPSERMTREEFVGRRVMVGSDGSFVA